MRKIKEVLRLRYVCGLSEREIAASCRIAHSTVSNYLKRAEKAGLGWPEALAGIFRSRYLKRFESSIEAFRISVRRALEFTRTFESYVLDGKVLDSTSFQKAMRYLAREDEEDDSTPASQADALDATEEAREVLEGLPTLDPTQ